MTIKQIKINKALEYHNIYKLIFTDDCKIHCSIMEYQEHDNLSLIVDEKYGLPKSMVVFPNMYIPNRSCIFVVYTNWTDETILDSDTIKITEFIQHMVDAHQGEAMGVLGYVN